MLFVSLTFLFLFLPTVLVIYYILSANRKAQNILLLLASLAFYAWGEPSFALILIASILTNWILALFVAKGKNDRQKKSCIIIAVILNIGLLFLYKYSNFVLTQINIVGHLNIPLKDITLPVGISFFTFQALSYVIDVYRGEKYQKNPLYVGLYIAFFPQLIAGPIVRYNSISDQIDNRKETLEKFEQGVLRFIQGFSKKILLANTMAIIADKAFELIGSGLTVSFAWFGAIAYTLQIYFDFSAYSDMAIGLGKMFGFVFEENFNYPYTSKSVTEFWRRWHISLSTWFRDYVYFPLGGNRTGNASRNYLNLFIVWLLTGIWHGANWTFIVWGLLYFVFLILEKATPFGLVIKGNKIIGHLYTMLVVILLWVIFRADNLQDAFVYIQSMFGVTNVEIYSGITWVYLKENIVYLFFAVMLSSNIVPIFRKKIVDTLVDYNIIIGLQIVYEVCILILFVISIVYVINGTYNPFIYFHF